MANGTPERMQTLRDLAIGAVAMVVGAALLFALVGAVSDDGPDITAGPDPSTSPTASPDDQSSTPAGGPDASGSPTPAPTSSGTANPSETPTADADRIDPGGLTIQVLDGVLDDQQALHDAVVACLQADGYDNLIPGNRARTAYAETVIFYTAGSEAAAQQVASDLGVGDVQEQPGNLNEDVPVHIVVGADAAC